MPYANKEGVRIHYEVVGGGPALVLLPGMLMAAHSWCGAGWVEAYWRRPSWVKALASDYRLVLVEAPGARCE